LLFLKVREDSARALGNLGDPSAVEPLVLALRDKNSLVRAYAARALGELKDVRGVDGLRTVMADGNPRVRDEAKRSLDLIVRAQTRMARFDSVASRQREGWTRVHPDVCRPERPDVVSFL
jgi:HEAT repeat protein